jgi:hypothetical protein
MLPFCMIPPNVYIRITLQHIFILYFYLFHFSRRLGGSQIWSGPFIEEKNLLPLPGIYRDIVTIRYIHIYGCFYGKTNKMHNISNLFYFGTTLYMFRTVSPSIIRSLRLYTQHQVYVIQVLCLLASKQPQNLYGMML